MMCGTTEILTVYFPVEGGKKKGKPNEEAESVDV